LTLGHPAPSIIGMVGVGMGAGRVLPWLLGLRLLGAAPESGAETLDEVVSRAIAAQGGAERLRASQTRITVGKISFDGGGANPFTVEQKRPNRLHMEIFFPTGVLVRAYDGLVGWQASPFAESKDAAQMSVEDTKNIAEEAEFDDPLLDWKARGSQALLLGQESVEGRTAYRVRVTARSGLVQDLLLDSETHLRTRWEGARQANGKETVFVSSFKDYRAVGGIQFPFRIESRAQGNESRQEIVITRVELNTPIHEARFALLKPAAKPPEAPKP
jgi:hypothetical protein